MPEAFSLNREYDFVRLEGLYRTTGRPAHDWDLYIVKELIDNALDADEAIWNRDPSQFPDISIHIEYISVPPPQQQQLLVRVSNRAPFPIGMIQDIFATQWYTSRKAFLKGLTRGALGNALKTLLGIPYALHNRVADDWKPDLKPLSICQGSVEYLPRFIVDPTSQAISLAVETKVCKFQTGTLITVGLDYFVQEMIRTREEIAVLAHHYHTCNPHVAFHWSVEVDDQIWEKEYRPQLGWTNKFSGPAPVHWYSLADFKELLGALYREQNRNAPNNADLSIDTICRFFSGIKREEWYSVSSYVPHGVLEEVGQNSLSVTDIEGVCAKTLYASLGKHSLPFSPSRLGSIGRDFLRTVLQDHLPTEGNIQYLAASDPESDPSMPFVIEAAAVYLKEGKRQLWTALNFAPTYNDPFLSRYLYAPMQPHQPVLGLRGLLDTYGFREDTPMLLFVHLICPNIEHNEFSKTEINHLPFKKTLGEVLDRLLIDLRRGQEEDGLHLEQTIYQMLNAILEQISEHERFIPEQLLEQLRQQLSRDQTLTLWLDRPDTLNRLRTYIASYQTRNPIISHFVARRADMLLHVPLHPKHYFSVPIDHLSHDLVVQHYINKMLYVQSAELEPAIIDNNWLCRMDMALLHCSQVSKLEKLLLYCIEQCDLPILVLHDGDDVGQRLVEQLRQALKPLGHEQRVIDLNPHTNGEVIQPTKLMPGVLESLLVRRFEELGLPVKCTPPLARIRKDISAEFEQRLRGYLIERIGQRFEITNLIIDLDTSFEYTKKMIEQTLDEFLITYLEAHARSESYASVLRSISEEFFEQFMEEFGGKVRQREHFWLAQRRGKLHDA